MGRKKTTKKRKVEEGADADGDDADNDLFATDGDAATESATSADIPVTKDVKDVKPMVPITLKPPKYEKDDKTKASNYAIKTHSAEIFDTDIYVSDGSDDDDDDDGKEVEIVLAGSRMGMMRRGIHHPSMLVQQNRQWVRPDKSGDAATNAETLAAAAAADAEASEEQRVAEELAKLDPAQRAARLLQEKQRKLEEAKELARQVESEENAGREPLHFSKRTAFDIRFDQIEDKPWERGVGDMTDFFNYGLSEEEWLEYGQQQLAIRQELLDAHREKRAADPNIVPVIPKKATPTNMHETEASVNVSDEGTGDQNDHQLGPSMSEGAKQERPTATIAAPDISEEDKQKYYNIDVGCNGAWGAGASSDSKLAQLIQEQERTTKPAFDHGGYNDDQSYASGYANDDTIESDIRYGHQQEYYARNEQGWGDDGRSAAPPPPPPQHGFRGRGFAGRYDARDRGGRFHQWEDRSGGRGGGGHHYDQREHWR